MSYCLVIEGLQGARRILSDAIPRRGEWLSLEVDRVWWWFPVMEVSFALLDEEPQDFPMDGCRFVHERVESIVYSSLSVGIRVEVEHADDGYKLVLPPPRWPYGGTSANDVLREVGWKNN